MRTLGLIGKDLSHSFSKNYFTKKFLSENITDAEYLNFELKNISDFKLLINKNNLSGLNVTIPYKESIIPFLDELSEAAKQIGAVNTIQFINNKLTGHNTDYIGFTETILPLLKKENNALILGNGGASKAIQFALNRLNIQYKIVSRNTSFNYLDISKEITEYHNIIINTTPLGTFPNTEEKPPIPYELLNKNHVLYDLVYNPAETQFLKLGKQKNCQVKNGLEMLKKQAEASWNIWNS